MNGELTSYELKQISRLSSYYSIRFYELLIQYKSTGERFLTLIKLREAFELTKEYPRFYDFKKRIISPSVSEINLNTDLFVEWDVIKKGKVITGLVFKFKEKKTIN